MKILKKEEGKANLIEKMSVNREDFLIRHHFFNFQGGNYLI
jgi:hypothetical protein